MTGNEQLTRERQKSLWLHRAVLERLRSDPESILGRARANLEAWHGVHRPGGMAERYLAQWREIIDGSIDGVVDVLVGTDPRSCELRKTTPFAGVLTDEERRQVLAAFREHWRQEHPGQS
ncbi:hypothetical protein [Brachybacterium aquaticum]|uniref:Uncharacterized protein n=1 Tax=Brachybacterium aquaticum TaxID=1432564 RepID=A0A841AF14_9MICO|nr:hypothetical protein [Brachybacterium aquaticum]MBB5831915.1 hypothetical protein [Brachybacterium aquaticum]